MSNFSAKQVYGIVDALLPFIEKQSHISVSVKKAIQMVMHETVYHFIKIR